ncbi:hypothetical protein [Hyphomicrobium sp. NDB2Meth4]|uniref:hypothetical protein n=1 Tax=Hyphomicrobium sp. NDB2Meth4 TaxID=1892846 RepID=UPI0009304535|nr:hypothetical protein [Hyphomicrobium sp. NDB2Meth4]
MLTIEDYWITWIIVGSLSGTVSSFTLRSDEVYYARMIDGILGACVGGEIIRRWDPLLVTATTGLVTAAVTSALFLLVISRLRRLRALHR